MNLKVSNFLYKKIGTISPSLYYHLAYFHNHNRWPNLRNPKDLSEVIGRQCITGEINQYGVYADKVAVREYIEKWVGDCYLPTLYGVWNSFDDVDFDVLPKGFALKTNHGCGGNVICFDKDKLDYSSAKQIIDSAMSMNFGSITETQYSNIPRKVFAEQLISDNGELPIDYKFHCWKGSIMSVLCCVERGKEGHVKLKNYDANWNPMHILKKYEAPLNVSKPSNFDEMKEVATKIAKNFLHVRVDLYSLNGKTYVGELTFTPEGGLMRYYTRQGLLLLAGN